MKNNQNNRANFKEILINAEFGEKLARFKILADFISNSLVYYYETAYGSENLTQEDHNRFVQKYDEMKAIVESTFELFEPSTTAIKVNG